MRIGNLFKLIIALFMFVSCNSSELDNDDIKEAEILKTTTIPQLKNSFGVVHSTYKLDDRYLLIVESAKNFTTQIFKFDLELDSIVKTSEVFYTDLRVPIGIRIVGDFILLPNRFEKFTILNTKDLSVNKEIKTSIGNYYYDISENAIFYQNISSDSIEINSLDIASGNIEKELSIPRGSVAKSSIYSQNQWKVNSNNLMLISKDLNNKITLNRFDWINNKNIWSKYLSELKLVENETTLDLYLSNSEIILFTKDNLYCFSLIDGEKKWNKSLSDLENPFVVDLIQGQIILGDERALYSFNLKDGKKEWSIKKYSGERGLMGGINWSTEIGNITKDEELIFINMFPINLSTGQILWNPVLTLNVDLSDRFLTRVDLINEKNIAYCITNGSLNQLRIK